MQTISSFDVIFFCSNQAYIWDSSSFPDLWSRGFGPLVSGGIDGGWAMLSNLQNWAFREVLKYTPVRLIFHIAKYPLSVIFASLRLFSFWLRQRFPTGWSSEVRFAGTGARVGHRATNVASRNQIPQLEPKVQSAVFPWIISFKAFLWKELSLDQSMGCFRLLTHPLFLISWHTENRNLKLSGPCKIQRFLMSNNTYV